MRTGTVASSRTCWIAFQAFAMRVYLPEKLGTDEADFVRVRRTLLRCGRPTNIFVFEAGSRRMARSFALYGVGGLATVKNKDATAH